MFTENAIDNIHIFNNIEFRAESCKALANYKLSQSMTLTEILRTTTHKFSLSAKELILAKYDAWFLYLQDVERLITMYLSGKSYHDKMIQYIEIKYKKWLKDDEIKYIRETFETDTISPEKMKQVFKILTIVRARIYSNLIENETEIFDQDYIKTWTTIHSCLVEYLLYVITETPWAEIGYFEDLSYQTTRVLHHTLYEVYELDIVYDTKSNYVILNYDDLVNDVYDTVNLNFIAKRLEVYINKVKELGYKVNTAKLKLYVNNYRSDIIKEVEEIAEKHGLVLIKE